MSGRRLLVLVAVLAAAAVPAGVLRALCVGNACASAEEGPAHVPFCTLPEPLRAAIAAGYREGRSPDVLAVAGRAPVMTEREGLRLPWPTTATPADGRVPLAISGTRVAPGVSVPAGATLDRVAPTVAEILGFERPFPEVRSGTAIDGIGEPTSEPPRLVLLIAWKGAGSPELEASPDAWPSLRSLVRAGAGTLDARIGSLPLDPAAVTTTIGTGGLPSQHGITASVVRNDAGDVVEAFGPDAPVHVIATLADDLEHADPRTLVGFVAPEVSDRGIVGGDWYPNEDPPDVILGGGAAVPLAVDVLLDQGFGADPVTDVVAVVLDGSIRSMDARTERIVEAAERATDRSLLVVVAGTGGVAERASTSSAGVLEHVETAVPGPQPVIDAVVPGGLFLDQAVLTAQGVTGQVVVEALLDAEAPGGERMFADAFQGFAVSFARYC